MPPSRDWRLVRLDTEAIRQRELRAYKRAEKKIDMLRRDLDAFRQSDVPGFRVWLHREFGAELTDQRRLQQAIDDRRGLLLEVEDVARRFRLSEAAAYRKVLYRRSNPEAAEAEDRAWEERELRRREKEAAEGQEQDDPFDDDRDDPSDMDDDDILEALFEEMMGFRLPGSDRGVMGDGTTNDMGLKEAYRAVVQRLHPDRAESFGETEQELWHQAQSAYRRGDLHALRQVLAHCEGGASTVGPTSPVSLIRRLIGDLRAQARALRDELSAARDDPAWGFTKNGNTRAFVDRIRKGLSAVRSQLSWILRKRT